MPAIVASAPGKAILLGEHAVVYNRPAIAVPIHQVQAKAFVFADPAGKPDEIRISAPGVNLEVGIFELPDSHPIRMTCKLVQDSLRLDHLPAMKLRIVSTIPIAAGLGSGAAVSISIIRALAEFLEHPLPNELVSSLAFQVEKYHHGNPSGIDNTVITYQQPIFYKRGFPMEILKVAESFTLIVADSGIQSPTVAAVAGVRQRWSDDPVRYDSVFDAITQLVNQARLMIENGPINQLGDLLTRNQELLQSIGVSCEELDRLVEAALSAGALGAKLSGGGMGGNMIALVNSENALQVEEAIIQAGAVRTIITQIAAHSPVEEG